MMNAFVAGLCLSGAFYQTMIGAPAWAVLLNATMAALNGYQALKNAGKSNNQTS